MFQTGLKRIRVEAIAVGCLALLACDDDAQATADAGHATTTKTSDAGSGTPDAGAKGNDVGTSSTPSDGGAGAAKCTAGELAFLGTWIASDGSQHWLRKTASATTYARIPAGKANGASLPTLWKIIEVCAIERSFVATSTTAGPTKFARVDWTQDAAGLALCVAVDDASDETTALAAARPSADSATGCKGGAWTTLTRKDGGT